MRAPRRRSLPGAEQRTPFRLAADERIDGGARRRRHRGHGRIQVENVAVGHARRRARLDPELLLQHRRALLIQVQGGGAVAAARVTAHERAPRLFIERIEPHELLCVLNRLAEGSIVLEQADEIRQDLYRALTEIEVTGQYIDEEKGIHLMATRPALRLDSAGQLVQVSFNNLDRAPMALPAERTDLFYRAYGAFARLANDRRLQYRRRLAPGALVLFDNWRLLHARDAYSGYRRLGGVYLNKEDVESRLRALRLKAGAQASAA